MWPSSLVHATPTFSVWLQLCEPQGKCWQSKSSSSSPEHWTLSRAIIAGDGPKYDLEEGEERREKGRRRKKGRQRKRERARRKRRDKSKTNLLIAIMQISTLSTFQPAVAPDGRLKSQHTTDNGGLLIPKVVITHTAPLTSSTVEDFHCTFIDAIEAIHVQTNWVLIVDGGNYVCVCVYVWACMCVYKINVTDMLWYTCCTRIQHTMRLAAQMAAYTDSWKHSHN